MGAGRLGSGGSFSRMVANLIAGLGPLIVLKAGLAYVDLAVMYEAGLLAVMKLAGELKFDMGD